MPAKTLRAPDDVLAHLRAALDLADREYAQPVDLDRLAARPGCRSTTSCTALPGDLRAHPRGSTSPSAGSSWAGPVACTNLTVTEVCHAVGSSSSLGSFSSRFQALVGESERLPAKVCRDGRTAHPGVLRVHVGPRRAFRNRGEAGTRRRSLAWSHDHQHLHRQRLREGHRRSPRSSTPAVSASEEKDDITLVVATAGALSSTPASPSSTSASPCPAIPPELVEAMKRAGERHHAQAGAERRQLPADLRGAQRQGCRVLNRRPSGPTASRRCAATTPATGWSSSSPGTTRPRTSPDPTAARTTPVCRPLEPQGEHAAHRWLRGS